MLANADFISGWRPGQSSEEYHADRTAKSRSQIITAITHSPAYFNEKYVRQSLPASEETAALAFGTLAHKAILEGKQFFANYAVIPEWRDEVKEQPLNKNTNLYKEKKKNWLETEGFGKEIVTEKERADLFGMIDSIKNHPDASLILSEGEPELSGYFKDPETELALRFRLDWWNPSLGVLADVKTTDSVLEEDFSKSIWNYRYDFQMAMYCEGIYEITGQRPKYPTIIAIEKKPPYECAVYVLDAEAMAIGLRDYRRATRLIRSSFDSGVWSRYQSKMKPIGLPYWAKRDLA